MISQQQLHVEGSYMEQGMLSLWLTYNERQIVP